MRREAPALGLAPAGPNPASPGSDQFVLPPDPTAPPPASGSAA